MMLEIFWGESEFKVFSDAIKSGGMIKGINAEGCANFSRKEIDDLTDFVKIYNAKGLISFKVTDKEVSSSVAKFLKPGQLEKLKEAMGGKPGDLLLVVADKQKVVYDSLSNLRLKLGEKLNLIDKNKFKFLWVTDFPLLEYSPEEKRYMAMHHPFTSPRVDDILLDYSLVKSDKEIKGARKLKTLDLKLIGMGEDFPVISDERQKAKRITEKGISKVEFLIDSLTLVNESTSALPVKAPDLNEFLKPTLHIQSNNQEIINKSKEIIGDEKNSFLAVKKLTQWVSEEIKDKLVDSFSSLNVLHAREGECQSHTYLYTAFARAAGIPTKVVNGIVYLEPKGFLYHTWAESYVGYWIAVDPTFGQIPVDATHIKLVEGDSFNELSPLINIIGRIRAEVVEYR